MESKCKRCSEVFGSAGTLIILEGPFPDKKCPVKDHPEQIEYETIHGPPSENSVRVSGTTNEKIASPFVTDVLPDGARPGSIIYRITLAEKQDR